MKYRYKEIVNWLIIILPVLFSLIVFYAGVLHAFIGIIVVCIIVWIFRYKNYVELDDIGVKQVNFSLFKRKIEIIPYKDIIQIIFGKNHTLSKVDVGNHEHYIYSISGEIMKIGMIFHFKKFRKTLEEKKYLMTQFIGNIDMNNGKIFSSNEGGFVKLDDEKMFILKLHDGKHSILNIKYDNIEQIEIVILSDYVDNDGCFYIKLKNKKFKEVFYGLKDCNTFMKAIKRKGVNAYFVSSDEIISDLKEVDMY